MKFHSAKSHKLGSLCQWTTEPPEIIIAVCITALTAVSCGKGSFYMHTLGCGKAFLETHRRFGGWGYSWMVESSCLS